MGDSYPAFPEPDRPLIVSKPEEEWERCPGVVSDIDPEWSTDKVVEWNMFAECELESKHAWAGADDGIRPLLYDLNINGFETRLSNLQCSGSLVQGGPAFISFEDEIPEGAEAAIESELPDGWNVKVDEDINKIESVVTKCKDVPPNEEMKCLMELPGSEVLEADKAFVRGLRKSL